MFREVYKSYVYSINLLEADCYQKKKKRKNIFIVICTQNNVEHYVLYQLLLSIGHDEETKISERRSWLLIYFRNLRGVRRDHGRFPLESHIIFTIYRMTWIMFQILRRQFSSEFHCIISTSQFLYIKKRCKFVVLMITLIFPKCWFLCQLTVNVAGDQSLFESSFKTEVQRS